MKMKTDMYNTDSRFAEDIARACCNIPYIDVDAEWEKIKPRLNKKHHRKLYSDTIRRISIAAMVALAFIVSGTILTGIIPQKLHQNNNDSGMITTPKERILTKPELFNEMPLDSIMRHIGDVYDVSVRFKNPEKAGLRIHMELDSGMTLNGFIKFINNFDQINAALTDIDGTTYIEIQ